MNTAINETFPCTARECFTYGTTPDVARALKAPLTSADLQSALNLVRKSAEYAGAALILTDPRFDIRECPASFFQDLYSTGDRLMDVLWKAPNFDPFVGGSVAPQLHWDKLTDDFRKRLLRDPRLDFEVSDDRGNTLLHLMCGSSNYPVCAFLFSLPELNINKRNGAGQAPLECLMNSDRFAHYYGPNIYLLFMRDPRFGPWCLADRSLEAFVLANSEIALTDYFVQQRWHAAEKR